MEIFHRIYLNINIEMQMDHKFNMRIQYDLTLKMVIDGVSNKENELFFSEDRWKTSLATIISYWRFMKISLTVCVCVCWFIYAISSFQIKQIILLSIFNWDSSESQESWNLRKSGKEGKKVKLFLLKFINV